MRPIGKLLSLLILALTAFGCQDNTPSELGASATDPVAGMEAAASTETGKIPGFLPAHMLPGDEVTPGQIKADQYSNYRDQHPQWYAITAPPSGDFRPMTEWEPMQAILLTCSDYLPQDGPVFQTFLDIVVASVDVGEVWIVVDSDSTKATLESRLLTEGLTQAQINEQVRYFRFENDAIWTIDFGPYPIINADNQVSFSDFRYYHQRVLDDAIPTRLANEVGVNTYRAPFNQEGGNFQADGKEYCYTSERELYYTGMTAAELLEVENAYFGCEKLIILKDITNDGTGHIDMFFKLVDEHKAIVGEYTTVVDATNKARMDDNQEILESVVYSDGSDGITVYRMPFPHPGDGEPRTYLNSTFFSSADGTNKINMWPMYTVDKDLEAEALAVWQEAMPDWDHVGIVSDKIAGYSGAVHCITRTIPALPLVKWIGDGECTEGTCSAPAGGYSGECIAQSEPDPGCWGPEWLCGCNDCESGCPGSGPNNCGELTYDGCCDGSVTMYCDNNEIVQVTCDNGCGWVSDAGWYDCGGSGSDPSGSLPRSCDEYNMTPNLCAGLECGDDGNGNDCGTCDAGFNCINNQCIEEGCEPDCLNKECGSDGCGGFCGTCTAGFACANGVCTESSCPEGEIEDCDGVCGPSDWLGDTYCDDGTYGNNFNCEAFNYDEGDCDPNACPMGGTMVAENCNGITWEGCCDDGTVQYCGTGADQCPEGYDSCLCAQDCASAGYLCTWIDAEGYAWCAEEESSNEPGDLMCTTECVPDCGDAECGDNGCGGSCGECGDGYVCSEGACTEEVCVPDCVDMDCGDDGCGGSCGECGEGFVCSEGACTEEVCVPDCEGVDCGDDGCGGTCGECGDGSSCEEGVCVGVCVPACDGKDCGDDGCGGTCGICGMGEECSQAGTCQVITNPDTDTTSETPEDVLDADVIETKTTGGGGCSTTSSSAPAAGLLMALLALSLMGLRRRFSL